MKSPQHTVTELALAMKETAQLGEFVFAQLVWTDRKGGSQMRQGNAAILAKRLETLRCEATLRLIDPYTGEKLEVIGGCEHDGVSSNNRLKWNWWYDKTALRSRAAVSQ